MVLPGFITVIDFETTSINNPRATEIGLVALDLNLDPIAHYETVINPGKRVDKRSLGVSRLSPLESGRDLQRLLELRHGHLNTFLRYLGSSPLIARQEMLGQIGMP